MVENDIDFCVFLQMYSNFFFLKKDFYEDKGGEKALFT